MSITMIVGDVHLGKGVGIGKPGIGSALNSRVADQFQLLEWILEQAILNNVTSIILTGDICEDVKPDYTLMIFFIQWLKKCETHNIDVHIIAGNHDIKRSGSYYTSALDVIQSAEVPNTFIYKQIETIYNGTVGFTFVPFRDRRSFNLDSATQAIERLTDILIYEAQEIPCTYDKVLIGHLALEGSIIVGDEFDDSANELMCPLNMFKNYEYTWMGHVHKPQVLSTAPYIAHIGSMDISDFGETDHQKIIVIYDSNLPAKFKEIKIPSRPLRRIRVSVQGLGVDTTQIILDAIEKVETTISLKNAIVKIEVSLLGSEVPNANRTKIESIVYGFGAYHICNFTESRSVSVVPLEKKNDFNNALSPKEAVKMYTEFVTFANDDDKNSFINDCYEIIESCVI